jgi:hypothetical protein
MPKTGRVGYIKWLYGSLEYLHQVHMNQLRESIKGSGALFFVEIIGPIESRWRTSKFTVFIQGKGPTLMDYFVRNWYRLNTSPVCGMRSGVGSILQWAVTAPASQAIYSPWAALFRLGKSNLMEENVWNLQISSIGLIVGLARWFWYWCSHSTWALARCECTYSSAATNVARPP